MGGILSNDQGVLAQAGGTPTVYGIEERVPYQSELDYFKQSPLVAGMAAEDGRIIINPFSKLSKQELDHVRLNEAARVWMRNKGVPEFDLTDAQSKFLNTNTYKDASPEERRATILARLLSGDPSAGQPTDQQLQALASLKKLMGIEE